jgi:FKBP-type peptidyl-prolyl cis-trans isomerase
MRNSAKVIMLAAALTLAACSNDSDDDKNQGETAENPEANTEVAAEADAAPQAVPDTGIADNKADLAYLEANKVKDGVITTTSGLQYKILETGTGATPSADGFVTIHYAGRLIDGSEFDSSYKRGEPATFPAGRSIKGFSEALLLMQVGDKWEITIPSELGYGERGGGDVIPPNATLIFDVELLAIKSEEEARAEQQAMFEKAKAAFIDVQAAFLVENATKEGVGTTASGLQYKMLTAGSGKKPGPTSQVTVHYEGKLISGKIFDSSYQRGETIQFGLDQVISGWTEGLQLMQEGAKYELYIPYTLGYGERGSGQNIPPFATLIFTVELISVDS